MRRSKRPAFMVGIREIIGKLTDNGVPSAERVDRIADFTKSVAVKRGTAWSSITT